MSNKSLCLHEWEVHAMLEGRLTQVRRPVKDQSLVEYDDVTKEFIYVHKKECGGYCDYSCNKNNIGSPYAVGDVVSIKETYCDLGDGSIPGRILYKATFDDITTEMMKQSGHGTPIWRSPATMPLWASRMSRVVTGVRVERVQEITLANMVALGFDDLRNIPSGVPCMINRYQKQWDSDYPRYPWEDNVWQWVYEVGEVK
jgi:hypothetical protein